VLLCSFAANILSKKPTRFFGQKGLWNEGFKDTTDFGANEGNEGWKLWNTGHAIQGKPISHPYRFHLLDRLAWGLARFS
jgi:hypothetical protein